MAHLTDGTLRRMVDDPDVARAERVHLDECAECQARFKSIAADAHSIANLFAVTDPPLDVARAFQRVMAAPAARPRFGFRLPMGRPARPLVLAFAAAIAGVALLAGVIARDSNTFTPNTVTPVPVTVADMQALSQLADYGTVTWTKQPSLQVVTNASDAAAIAGGLHPPVVSKLPKGVSTNITYAAMSQATAVFTFSADTASASAVKHGKTLPPLPKGMDGAQLTVTVGPAVGEIFGNMQQPSSGSDTSSLSLPQLVVGVSSAPTATSNQVTVKQMESYLLAQPGITPQLKAAINAIGDPSTTLPIPIPVEYATSTTVTIQGVKGVALGDNTGVGSAVIWVKKGVVYVVAGSIKQTDAIDIANNLK